MKGKVVKSTRRKRQGGFTLLEVIVSVGILAVGILGVAALQTTAITGNGLASRVTVASNLAQDKLEDLMSLEYTASYTDPDLISNAVNGGQHVDPNPPTGYQIVWDVTDGVPVVGSKSITVTVSWLDKGIQKNATLDCIKARF